VVTLSEIATTFAKATYGGKTFPPTSPSCVVADNGGSPGFNGLVLAPWAKSARSILMCRPQGPLDDILLTKVATLRKARVLAADEAQGLVLLETVVDHPGDVSMVTLANGTSVPVPAPFMVPNTYFRSQLLKIRDGRIDAVEGTTRPVFFGMDDGWSL
jgi:hypothetical protein